MRAFFTVVVVYEPKQKNLTTLTYRSTKTKSSHQFIHYVIFVMLSFFGYHAFCPRLICSLLPYGSVEDSC